MTTKTTKSGREYEIVNGKKLVWHADVDVDEGEEPFDVTMPLRFRVGALRPLKGLDMDDPSAMLEMLDNLIPNQADNVDKLDVNDLMEMVGAWFDEYKSLNGATVGEASGSSA